MIILDTNIISAIMAPHSNDMIIKWIDKQDTVELYLTTITISEIGYGIHLLPKGKRRELLENQFIEFVQQGFWNRILDFDLQSALIYPTIMTHRRSTGRPMSSLDGQIAAIARSKNFKLATRNIRDFEECELELINPFKI